MIVAHTQWTSSLTTHPAQFKMLFQVLMFQPTEDVATQLISILAALTVMNMNHLPKHVKLHAPAKDAATTTVAMS